MKRTWQISDVTGAARARIATARLAAAYGVPALDRTRLTSALGTQLRQCLTKVGSWLLTLDVGAGRAEPGALHVSLVACDPEQSAAQPPWRATVACREATAPVDSAESPDEGAELAQSLLGADEDTALVLERLAAQEQLAHDPQQSTAPSTRHTTAARPEATAPVDPSEPPDETTELAQSLLGADKDTALVLEQLAAQEELVAFHREELLQTNQGVVALHAELDAAGRAQREAFAAERRARTEAENARRRLTCLANTSAVLTSSLNHEEIVRRLPELLVPEYARSVDVWLFDGDGDRQPPTPHPAAAVVAARTGRPQYAGPGPGGLPGVDDQPPSALDPELPLLCIPLPTRRAPLGVLTLAPPGDGWDPDDAVMLIELARRASVAIDNARRFEHHRDIAETLQRALLTELPATPGLRLAARYLPATHGLNIGGDWYDAFRQPDGSLITVIGDVTGHGLHAAVMMSQLRTALRAYAVDGGSPGTLLTRLHTFLHHLQPDLYATAVIARFHPAEPTLTWAAAGHPPPVLRTPDGRVHALDAKVTLDGNAVFRRAGARAGREARRDARHPPRPGDPGPHGESAARLDTGPVHGRSGRAARAGHRPGHRPPRARPRTPPGGRVGGGPRRHGGPDPRPPPQRLRTGRRHLSAPVPHRGGPRLEDRPDRSICFPFPVRIGTGKGMVVLDAFVCLPHPAGGTAEGTVGSMWCKQRSRACEGRRLQTAWSRREG